MCGVLGISDARQKATSTRHLVAAWKDARLALGVADDEARHFLMLDDRLANLGLLMAICQRIPACG